MGCTLEMYVVPLIFNVILLCWVGNAYCTIMSSLCYGQLKFVLLNKKLFSYFLDSLDAQFSYYVIRPWHSFVVFFLSRKIVLATNIAESSITIDDVVYVIDCGKAKESSYDALNKLACLLPSWISKASAHQVVLINMYQWIMLSKVENFTLVLRLP